MTEADVKTVANIRTVGSENVADLAAITADAFRHDPFNNWMFKSQSRKHEMFTALAKYVYAPRGFCQIYEENGEGQAATMWMMPGGNIKEPILGLFSLMKAFALDDGLAGMKRGLATGKAMEIQHPKQPHIYLFTVGVKESARGRGLGRKMIEPVLEACDRTGTMVYLENSNPANERVYNSLGFEQVAMIEPMAGSEPLQAMERWPKH
ncbi:MAG: GNAT family N-acetyltransferase [Parasphingorhabdus sp.]